MAHRCVAQWGSPVGQSVCPACVRVFCVGAMCPSLTPALRAALESSSDNAGQRNLKISPAGGGGGGGGRGLTSGCSPRKNLTSRAPASRNTQEHTCTTHESIIPISFTNGKRTASHPYSADLEPPGATRSAYSTILPHIHPFMHPFMQPFTHNDGGVSHTRPLPDGQQQVRVRASRSGTPPHTARRSWGSN